MLMIPDNVWNEIKKIIPKKESNIGRPPSDPRLVLSGIFYIIVTGAQRRCLPDYYGKRSTVHGWLKIWTESGVFDRILERSIGLAVQKLGNPECFITDTSSSKAPFAQFGGKNSTDRSKRGIKKGIVIDMNKIILSILIDAANRHDSKLLKPHIPKLRKFIKKAMVMIADSAWDVKELREDLARENLALHAATNPRRNRKKRKIKPGGRWRIEQIFGMQQWNRGIKFCWTKTKNYFLSFVQLISAIHNFKLAGIFG